MLVFVSTRKITMEFFCFTTSVRVRIAGKAPKPRQFQARTLIWLGGAAQQLSPHRQLFSHPPHCFSLLEVFLLPFVCDKHMSSSDRGMSPLLFWFGGSNTSYGLLGLTCLARRFECPLFGPNASAVQPFSLSKQKANGLDSSLAHIWFSFPLGPVLATCHVLFSLNSGFTANIHSLAFSHCMLSSDFVLNCVSIRGTSPLLV